jgi:transcriptional regulator with PAS, ATPase and Fis domain
MSLLFEKKELLIGNSKKIQQIRKKIQILGPSPIGILITGNTGTGKELIALSLHQAHQNPHRPFITINCATLSQELFESELFGHVKGAFTGAIHHKTGLIQQAHQGDLFLDELAELPLSIQSKLLRVLQDGEFKKVGCLKKEHSEFRIIAATNKDLQQEIAQGRFRADLYYRIAGSQISTCSLHEISEDIPRIIAHFLQKKPFQIDKKALETLQKVPFWPGNVRQLLNAVQVGIAFAQNRQASVIEDQDLSSLLDELVSETPFYTQGGEYRTEEESIFHMH